MIKVKFQTLCLNLNFINITFRHYTSKMARNKHTCKKILSGYKLNDNIKIEYLSTLSKEKKIVDGPQILLMNFQSPVHKKIEPSKPIIPSISSYSHHWILQISKANVIWKALFHLQFPSCARRITWNSGSNKCRKHKSWPRSEQCRRLMASDRKAEGIYSFSSSFQLKFL